MFQYNDLMRTYCNDIQWNPFNGDRPIKKKEYYYSNSNRLNKSFFTDFDTIRFLKIEGNWKSKIHEEMKSFPPNLQAIYIVGWNAETIPELPESLLVLSIYGDFKKLPRLPSKLRVLEIGSDLKEIPSLPNAIQHVNVSPCPYLEKLPLIPFSVSFLKVYHMSPFKIRVKSCFTDLFNGASRHSNDDELYNFWNKTLTPRVIKNREKILKVKKLLVEKIKKRKMKLLFDNTPLCKDLCNLITDLIT